MLSRVRWLIAIAAVALLSACFDAKPVHVVLEGVVRSGAEPMLMLSEAVWNFPKRVFIG